MKVTGHQRALQLAIGAAVCSCPIGILRGNELAERHASSELAHVHDGDQVGLDPGIAFWWAHQATLGCQRRCRDGSR